uniref:Endonuclease n=1 Tax=Strongyloides venezuelensis TaxID=75913 RepID=A0A0K0EXC2_STRVS
MDIDKDDNSTKFIKCFLKCQSEKTKNIFFQNYPDMEKWTISNIQDFCNRMSCDSTTHDLESIIAFKTAKKFPNESIQCYITRLKTILLPFKEFDDPLDVAVLCKIGFEADDDLKQKLCELEKLTIDSYVKAHMKFSSGITLKNKLKSNNGETTFVKKLEHVTPPASDGKQPLSSNNTKIETIKQKKLLLPLSLTATPLIREAVRIFNRDVIVLIDSGATASILNLSTVEHHGWFYEKSTTIVEAYDSSISHSIGVLRGSVSILNNDVRVSETFHIVDKGENTITLNVAKLLNIDIYSKLKEIQSNRRSMITKIEDINLTDSKLAKCLLQFPEVYNEEVLVPKIKVSFPLISEPNQILHKSYPQKEKKKQFLAETLMLEIREGSEKMRMVIDGTDVNKVIQPITITLPSIQEIKVKMAGWELFYKFDFTAAFKSLQVDNDTSYIQTFATQYGYYKSNVLNFGYKVSTSLYVKEMERLFRQYDLNDFVLFVDDSVIESNGSGIKVDSKRHEELINLPKPLTAKMAKSVLGKFDYISQHIVNFSQFLFVLQLKTSEPYSWPDEKEEAWNNLKNNCNNYLRFVCPQKGNLLFIEYLPADGCMHAHIYFTLYNDFKNREKKIVSVLMRKLFDIEERYSIQRLIGPILFSNIGIDFYSKPIKIDSSISTNKIQIKSMKLLNYEISTNPTNVISNEVIINDQMNNPMLTDVKEFLENDSGETERVNDDDNKNMKNINMINGITCDGLKPIISSNLLLTLAQKIHNNTHSGESVLKKLISNKYKCNNLASIVKNIVGNCDACMTTRDLRKSRPIAWTKPSRPREIGSFDLFFWGKQIYILVIDHYSNFTYVQKLTSKKSDVTIDFFPRIFSEFPFGLVISDGEISLSAEELEEFFDKQNLPLVINDKVKTTSTQYWKTSIYHPSSNGKLAKAETIGTPKADRTTWAANSLNHMPSITVDEKGKTFVTPAQKYFVNDTVRIILAPTLTHHNPTLVYYKRKESLSSVLSKGTKIRSYGKAISLIQSKNGEQMLIANDFIIPSSDNTSIDSIDDMGLSFENLFSMNDAEIDDLSNSLLNLSINSPTSEFSESITLNSLKNEEELQSFIQEHPNYLLVDGSASNDPIVQYIRGIGVQGMLNGQEISVGYTDFMKGFLQLLEQNVWQLV